MREYERIADRIAGDRPAHVLDWGCGAGQMTSLLRERGLEVTAYDYRPGLDAPVFEPLEHYPDVKAHLSSEPVTLPFEDAAFDAVLSCGVLEHVHDPGREPRRAQARTAARRHALRLQAAQHAVAISRRSPACSRGWTGASTTTGWSPTTGSTTSASAREAPRPSRVPRARTPAGQHAPVDASSGRSHASSPRRSGGSTRSLARVPGLRRLATNVELIADAPA